MRTSERSDFVKQVVKHKNNARVRGLTDSFPFLRAALIFRKSSSHKARLGGCNVKTNVKLRTSQSSQVANT